MKKAGKMINIFFCVTGKEKKSGPEKVVGKKIFDGVILEKGFETLTLSPLGARSRKNEHGF